MARAQAPCDQAPPVPAATAASKARAENGFSKQDTPVEGPCTCEELDHYLKRDVDRKEKCYRQAYDVGRAKPFADKPAVDSFVESCMSWQPGSAQSQGKAGAATPQQRKTAYEKCRQAHCQWICDFPINCVHERYHDWFEKNAQTAALTLIGQMFDQESMSAPLTQEMILNEIGAHDAEKHFLEDRIEEARRKGNCEGVTGSIQSPERNLRHQEASKRAQKYVDSLGGER